jgi:2,4-dienoyl-CoA reductase-like NADH-dependent reductase (Old Yellow Enzyme family)
MLQASTPRESTYVANNGYDKVRGQAAVAEGKADAVAFGRPFIANPDLATRFLLDAPLTPSDGATLYGGDEKGYTDYPILTTVARASSMANINRMESCSSESYDQV